ncbi:MAG: hypothetical protein IT503_07205 [Burkholderiaceae bacterium]|nr:MAG: hypothetical protein F9K36_02180 [Burkholderiaceae bacterium]MBE7427127.1 hypothetical protein [Ideonella sp.]MCC7285956.1 hypothetical protein [Burkholderiaceae bacterium]
MKSIGPFGVLIVVVLGGIYSGLVTVNEASALGALAVVVRAREALDAVSWNLSSSPIITSRSYAEAHGCSNSTDSPVRRGPVFGPDLSAVRRGHASPARAVLGDRSAAKAALQQGSDAPLR